MRNASLAVAGLLVAFACAATSAAHGERGSGVRAITAQEARAWHPDMRSARRYAARRAGTATFAVADMRGRLHRERAHHRVLMGSTFKVMLLVAYLRRIADREITREERELLVSMIRRSDNDAASTIDARLGRGPIEALARDARMRRFQWADAWGLSRTTAHDQAFFMRTLRRYIPVRHWRFARNQLAEIMPSQRWGIGQVDLPRGWHVHFKGGWLPRSGVDHQVALLRNGSRRIGLAVMTEGNPSHEYGKATLAGVFRRLLHGLPR